MKNISLILITIYLILIGGTTTMHTAIQTPGTIYTGLPDQNDSYYQPQQAALKKLSQQLAPKSHQRLVYGDVWLRDIAPIVTNAKMVKSKYEPDYLDTKFNDIINTRFAKWLEHQHFDLSYSDIRLDGGNFVYNDADTAILTDRVLYDNPSYSQERLVKTLQEELGLKQIILIDEEPGDVMGHADGMLFFIKPKTLFVGDFEGVDHVKKQIKQADPSINFINLPSAYTEKGQFDRDIPSAKGLYTNMLTTETQILVPQYALPEDEAVLKQVRTHTTKQVIPVPVDDIATMGGSVHCLTWYLPQRLKP